MDRTCAVAGCEEAHFGRGYCTKHYNRWHAHGDPLAGGPPRRGRGSPPGPCTVKLCDRPARTRGWCLNHYGKWKKYGDPLGCAPAPSRAPAGHRFWPKVDKQGPVPLLRPELGRCWTWMRATDKLGYGRFTDKGPPPIYLAHVWAYVEAHGPVPGGTELDHLCRTPSCVRPSHLEPVPHRTNVLRGEAAQSQGLTHCPAGHAYDLANTYITPTGGWKVCRKCRDGRKRRRP